MKNKKIELTDVQYKELVKLLFYGEWILNANKVKAEEHDEDATNLTEYIFSKKAEFNLSDWFRDIKFGEELKHEITMSLLNKVFEYNEDTFWFYLIEKLADRDATKKAIAMRLVDEDEIDNLRFKYQEKYEKAFENREINDLFLKEK